MIQSLTAYLFLINCKIILFTPFSFQKFSFDHQHTLCCKYLKLLQIFFFISSYSMYRNVVFIVLLMLPRSCFLFHKTVLNERVILIRGKFTMKIRPKYILRKGIHRFIQSAQILLPSTAQGNEVWENTDQVNTNQNARIYLRTTLPYDIPVQWYQYMICVIDQTCSAKMTGYWPSSFFFSRFYGLGRSRGP